jgi:hypothetical protein
LSAGNYAFQVKGTGFGSGNSLDYMGSVTFAATAVVSPVPEPSTLLLTLPGLALVHVMTRVRVSSLSNDPAEAYHLQSQFLEALLANVDDATRARLLGSRKPTLIGRSAG